METASKCHFLAARLFHGAGRQLCHDGRGPPSANRAAMVGHGFITWAHHYVDVSVTSTLTLASPVTNLKRGMLTVAVKDRQGNVTWIERTLSVGN